MSDYSDAVSLIEREISSALNCVDTFQVERLVDEILKARQVFCVGVGRVHISLQAFVKRLNHFGIRAFMVGALDEPAITKDDLLIVGSGSGSSVVPVAIARVARRYDARIIHIGSNPEGPISEFSDSMVRIPVRTKLNKDDEIDSKQIMSSLFEQSLYILCDSVCLMIAKRLDTDIKALWRYHANLE